ncbi:AraC family transcriptional regulator, partial [bacterium]
SPMEFVRRRRLLAIRQRLEDPHETRTVADVITSHGIGNPGRFAGVYREVCGESPSETAAKVRGTRKKTGQG